MLLFSSVLDFRDCRSWKESRMTNNAEFNSKGGNMYTVRQIDQHKLENFAIMSQIWAFRYQVFCKEKKWIPENVDEIDIDQFDASDVKHFACLNDHDLVVGYFRLLPTTGSYMLKDIFPVLMGGKSCPNNSETMEVSRFVINRDLADDRNEHNNVAKVTSALLITLFEYAALNNVKAIVGVCDISFEKILRRAGLLTVRYSAPMKIGNCLAVAGYAEPSELNINRLKQIAYSEEPEIVANHSAATTIKKLQRV